MKYKINKRDLTNIKITATANIEPEECIGIWVTNKPTSKNSRYLFQKQMSKSWWETEDLGRYCNHSDTPNTFISYHSDKLELIAIRGIKKEEEILVDYTKLTELIGFIPYLNFEQKNDNH